MDQEPANLAAGLHWGGWISLSPAHVDGWVFISLAGSLLVTISGCTGLNMLFDMDIDYRRERIRHRPLVDGRVKHDMAAWLSGGRPRFGRC